MTLTHEAPKFSEEAHERPPFSGGTLRRLGETGIEASAVTAAQDLNNRINKAQTPGQGQMKGSEIHTGLESASVAAADYLNKRINEAELKVPDDFENREN